MSAEAHLRMSTLDTGGKDLSSRLVLVIADPRLSLSDGRFL